MDFNLSDEQQAIQSLARDFVNGEIIPQARKYDEEEKFPIEIMDQLRVCGLFNLAIPESYGGPGIDKISHALIVEELARGCAGITTSVEANSLSSYPLLVGGDEDLKKEYLNRLTIDGMYASFALTEPQAGSDVNGLSTTARRVGNEYVLNGEKCFITNASHANFFVVLAKQHHHDGSTHFTAFVVDRELEGVAIGKKEKKMGIRASDTASVIFNDVRVPLKNRIGGEGEGFTIFMKSLSHARPMVGAQSLGIARGAYEEALHYSKERKQFNKPIATFQSIQFMLADMAMNIEAARLLVHKAVFLLQEGRPSITSASYAKCFAADTAVKVATDAVQIFGGYGYIREYPVEKYYRDAKIMQIYEGTNQIQRVVIAKEILS
ncbi:acyl-CoA dehydrogenase family protein [Massilibacterium senegalense]|uniref:acyl-CoA dehydrogenase family protein n=1 Tax=Massilibacterium senegalense TaxID=1632858 RepID=UPI000782D8D9|nr:acyl-CoA dehydrogenase family protein [Massilibacterium senegalense]